MIWIPILLTALSGYALIGCIVSRRWIYLVIALAALVMNVGSVVIQIQIEATDAAVALSGTPSIMTLGGDSQNLTNKSITKRVPYRSGMTLSPGESTIIKIPVDPGTEI